MRYFLPAGLIAACLLLVVGGCNRMPPLALPDTSHVRRIEVFKANVFDVKTMKSLVQREITDASKLSQIMSFLGEKNTHMEVPWGTFPTPSHTIVIHDDKGNDVVIFVGPGWLGGRNSGEGIAGKNRLTALSSFEKTRLFKLLELPE